MSGIPEVVGVVGAGTMGAGIAQLAACAGMVTRLHDPVPEALQRGLGLIEAGLERMVAKGRLSLREAHEASARIRPARDLAELAGCEFVVEAAPERLDIKLTLFASLADVVGPECVLATNTSSLSVSEIAAAVPEPGRVVGLHFFNPAPVMQLVELVAGQASAPAALAMARAVGEAMGKRVIEAPGAGSSAS